MNVCFIIIIIIILILIITIILILTSEAADLDRVEGPPLQAGLPRVDGALPLAQATGVLELVGGEHEADQVAQQPPAVLLGGVDGLVPLLVGDEQRVVPQELLAALKGARGGILSTC